MELPETPLRKEQSAERCAISVLCVEDEPATLRFLTHVVRRRFGTVFEARDGREGLTLFQRHHPSMVITDIRMPNMDGLSMARAIHQESPLTPLVISTSLGEVDVMLQAFDVGATDYMIKPLVPKRIHEALDKCSKLIDLEQALLHSKARIESILGSIGDAFFALDDQGRFTYLNAKAEACLRLPAAETLGRHYGDVLSAGTPVQRACLEAMRSREPGASECLLSPLDTLHEVRVFPFEGGISVCLRDISERRLGEIKLQRMAHLYVALSQCNEAIVRCKSEGELFQSICRTSVLHGGLKLAWIGMVDPESRRVNVVSSYGEGSEYLDSIQISVDAADPFGRGPTGTAIREREPFWCQDFLRDPATARWHERGRAFGWRASAALPLERNGCGVGAFNLYSDEMNAFDVDAQKLLLEMATDIGFALDNFAREEDRKRTAKQLQHYVAQLERSFLQTVGMATSLSEMRDPYTVGHERKVAEIASAIGTELGFDAHRRDGLRVAGHLHDIGKFSIPIELLVKPGRLSPIEFAMIQGHPQAGYEALRNVDFPWPVARVVLQHHERMDGSGYPNRTAGDDILLEARIIAVADVIEARASHRPYRPSLGIENALAEIERGSGSAYDPEVAGACLRLFRQKGFTLPR